MTQSPDRHDNHYRLLFENMINGFIYCRVIDAPGEDDFEFLDVNKAFETFVGLKNIIHKKASEVIPEIRKSNPELFRACSQAASTGQAKRIEAKIESLGASLDISVYSPHIGFFAAVFRNITQQKKTEESLREGERRYRTLFETMNEGFCLHEIVLDTNGAPLDYRLLDVNPAFEKIIGLSKSAVIGKLSTVAYGVEAPPYLDIYSKVALTGAPIQFETDFDPMGKSFSITVFSPSQNMFATVFEDITERKLTEARYLLFRNRLNYAFEAAHIGAWELNLVDHTAWRSLRHDAIFGNTELLPNWTFEMFIDQVIAEDRDEVKTKFQRALDTKTDWDFECRIKRVDEAIRWIWAKGNPQFDDNDRPLKMFGILQDITERKEAEEQLNTQKMRAQKLESLGILAGGIAHDFNNLLGGIFGYIDLAGELARDPKLREYLAKAMAALDRGRDLTRQLITFAKGGAPVQSVGHLFPLVQETAQFALSGSNVSCGFDIQADLWPCNFDKNQIGQVIDNIVINAKQAMPGGGQMKLSAENVRLRDKERPLLNAGAYVLISVTDKGIGMPADILPRIFDPFFSTKSAGHGLGLATSFSIVKRHGGAIEVESQPGKGSVFHVFLPAIAKRISSSRPKETAVHLGSGTFLVMDDESVMLDVTRGMLESCGYTVACVENGLDALKFFSEEAQAGREISGAIFDLTVPGAMGGKEAVSQIRKMGCKIPIFAASGHAEDPIIANPLAFGFTGSICKPFRKSELLALLSGCMEKPASK